MDRATRGRNRFLTEQDTHLLTRTSWAKREPFRLGTNPAIIVVDAYRAALGDSRGPLLEAVDAWPSACGPAGWAAVDRIVPVLAAARDRATAIDACVLGYRLDVVEDCCFDRIEASRWMSLFDLDQKFGDVIDSATALRYLGGDGAEPRDADEVGA